MNALRTCPDCGGILEPTRPVWAAAIQFEGDAAPADAGPLRWRCLICGYYERAGTPAIDADAPPFKPARRAGAGHSGQ